MIGHSAPNDCYLDFGSDSVKVAAADGSTVLPLERESDGSFSPATCVRLREVLARSSDRRARVICGIPARGASLRRVLLPVVAAGQTRSVVCLQVEREFPLSPDELAWGFQLGDVRNGESPPRREAIVVALRRELIEPYCALLADLDRTLVFCIGSLAACALHSGRGRVCHVDLGRRMTEVVWCEHELPVALRVVTWGGESVTQRIAQVLETSPEEAEHVKLSWAKGSARLGEIDESAVQKAVAVSLDDLVRRLVEACRRVGEIPSTFVFRGGSAGLPGLEERIGAAFPEARCEVVEVCGNESAVIRGLREQQNSGVASIELTVEGPTVSAHAGAATSEVPWPWMALVAVLFGLGSVLPFVASSFRIDRIRTAVETARARLDGLPDVSQEVASLDLLASRDLWPLENLDVIRQLAPPGFHLEELKLDQQRLFFLSGTVPHRASVHELRRRLTGCGVTSLSLPEIVLEGEVYRFRLVGWLPGRLSIPRSLAEKLAGQPAGEVAPSTETAEPGPSDEETPTPVTDARDGGSALPGESQGSNPGDDLHQEDTEIAPPPAIRPPGREQE